MRSLCIWEFTVNLPKFGKDIDMNVTGTVQESYNFNINLEKVEYEYLIGLAAGYGITLEEGIFKCLTTQAHITVVNP